MRFQKSLLGLAFSLSAAVAWALPNPQFTSANPQMVYSGAPGFTDSNGRVAVTIMGSNLAPSDGYTHPAGWSGGYQHVFVRSVSAGNHTGNWVRCTPENGCIVYGGTNPGALMLGFDPGRFLGEPGSHAQVKLWVSLGASDADNPEQGTVQTSGWSNIWTVDSAPAGAKPPVKTAPPPKVPTLTKVTPNEILVGAHGTSYRIRLYGDFCGQDRVVIFGGDASTPVAPEENNCRGYDDDGSFLPANVALIHVTVPEKFRRTNAGPLKVQVQTTGGRSNTMDIQLKGMTVKQIAPPMGDIKPPLAPAVNTNAQNATKPVQVTTTTVPPSTQALTVPVNRLPKTGTPGATRP